MAATYDIGDTVRVRGQFRDQTDALVDPTTVKGIVESDAGLSVVTATRESLGSYIFDVDVTVAGWHNTRIVGYGANKGAEEGGFDVRASEFATPLP